MGKGKLDAIFLDTSIQIARVVHGPSTKDRIRRRVAQHNQTVTSLVVRQEYKRRLLKEAEYLLTLLHRYQSYDEVNQHLIRLGSKWHDRKRNICLQTVAQVHDGSDDEERAERLQLYLHSLLLTGLTRFDQRNDVVRTDSQCGCGKTNVTEKVPLRKYVFGPKRCSAGELRCGIVDFLLARRDACGRILKKIQSLSPAQKTAELTNAEQFLVKVLANPARARDEDPCLEVGDLLIALESLGVPNFFTLNSAESQHLSKALEQTLIVRPISPLEDDIVCEKASEHWPLFPRKQQDKTGETAPANIPEADEPGAAD